MTKKPAPKKKPRAVVQFANKMANKNLRRVLSHALASGLRNVRSFDVARCSAGIGDDYYRVSVEFYDRASKGKWR